GGHAAGKHVGVDLHALDGIVEDGILRSRRRGDAEAESCGRQDQEWRRKFTQGGLPSSSPYGAPLAEVSSKIAVASAGPARTWRTSGSGQSAIVGRAFTKGSPMRWRVATEWSEEHEARSQCECANRRSIGGRSGGVSSPSLSRWRSSRSAAGGC